VTETADVPPQFRRGDESPRPVTDPTELTTRAVALAADQFRRELGALRSILEARLDAMDMATKLRLENVAGIRPDTERQVDHLRVLHAERFASIETQLPALREFVLGKVQAAAAVTGERFEAVNTRFLERDKAIEQAAQEARISLQTALAAAKEAVALQNEANNAANIKTESNFTKQIDALGAAFAAGNKALDDKIADLKSRLDSGEGREGGAQSSRTEHRLDTGQVISIVAVLLTMVGLLFVAFHT
jgi:hypothetical protein